MDRDFSGSSWVTFLSKHELLLNIIVECNFAELVDLLNSDRVCSLEVAWIWEDIKLICNQFVSISFCVCSYEM